MKIYKFYLCKKVIHPNRYSAISPENIFRTKNGKYSCLYGYTDDKDIRDEFIEYRNMNIFKLVTENTSKDEYEIFVELHPDEELTYASYGTSVVVDGITKIEPVQLISTIAESNKIFLDYDMIAESSIYSIFTNISNSNNPQNFFNDVHNFSNMFKQEITDALKYLEFENIMYDYFGIDARELPFKTFEEDKLMAYVKLFSNTYKEGML